MTLNLFPTTVTISWDVEKSPNWSTRMQRAVSGREIRTSDYVIPIYTYTLKWEFMRDKWNLQGTPPQYGRAYPTIATPYDELRQVWNFFNTQQGANIPFRFLDPSDNNTRPPNALATPASSTFAIGDGTTTTFQMASPLLAPAIPNVIISVTPAVSYTIDPDTGLITFSSAPANGVSIGADFSYYMKLRFAEDQASATNFLYQLWSLKALKLVSVLF